MNVSPHYLKYETEGQIPDYRHWQVPLGRRFRSLKVWFVLRTYGLSGLQAHIRKHVKMALAFSNKLKSDDRFEITHPVTMGLVCFRIKGTNDLNEKFVNLVNNRKIIHIMSTMIHGRYIVRFAICSTRIELSDIDFAFKEILTTLEILNNSELKRLEN